MSKVIGFVETKNGQVDIKFSDGRVANLNEGDFVYSDCLIMAGVGAYATILLENSDAITVKNGETALLDESVYRAEAFDNIDISITQEAALDGDYLNMEDTSAGEGDDGIGGHANPFIAERSNDFGDIDSHDAGNDELKVTILDFHTEDQTYFSTEIIGTQGDDNLIADNMTEYVDGGQGTDTLILVGTNHLDFSNIDNIEIIDFNNNFADKVDITALDVFMATDENNYLKILGEDIDKITNSTSEFTTDGSTVSEGDVVYHVYTANYVDFDNNSHLLTLLIEDGIDGIS